MTRTEREPLSGQRIVITGATSGIGRAVADRLARVGAKLILVARRADPLAEAAGRLGGTAVAGDLTDAAFQERLAAVIEEEWSEAPDVLINNAGAFALAAFGETDPAVFERLIAVNLRGPFELTRLCLPGMLSRGSGHIVNIGSIAGRKAFPGNAAYSASKYGLRGLHEVLVEELRGTGVRSTWIEPSAVNTPLWDAIDPDAREDLPSRADMLPPEAVADAVSFAIAQPSSVAVEEIVIRSNVSRRERIDG